MTATTTTQPDSFADSPASIATANGYAITLSGRWSQGSVIYNEQERITVNWTDRGSVLTEPRDRYHLPPIVLILWVTIILAVMWAGIVAIAWVVWNAL